MPDKKWKWGTEEVAWLSKRMAYRVGRKIETQKRLSNAAERRLLPIRKIVLVGFGQSNLNRREWYPNPTELRSYDDSWQDFSDNEKDCLIKRLNQGADPDALFEVFQVDKAMATALRVLVFGEDSEVPLSKEVPLEEKTPIKSSVPPPKETEAIAVESHESEDYDIGRYGPLDFEKVDDRRYANRRWIEHEERVDLEKPVNQTTVDMMILLEIDFRRTRRDCGSEIKKTRGDAFIRLKEIRAEYSKAAADVSQLEKQFKKEPDQDSLDAVILRTHDIRPDWRDTSIEREMAERALFDMLEQFHRTHLDVDEMEKDAQELPEPKPRPVSDGAGRMALRRLQESETEEGIVVGSTN
jgi:hypothetical protein